MADRAEGTRMACIVRKIIGPKILLYSGTYFDFLDPERSDLTIEDIAHGLSNICRFAGQCHRFYSVAQHCVHMADLAEPPNGYAALMHDALESVVGDVSRPLKDLLPDYRAIEARCEAAIFRRFAVPSPLPPEVKMLDMRMLITEQRQLMRNRDDWDCTRGLEPLPLDIPVWDPEQAESEFMDRYVWLKGGGTQ
ncbi:MAG: metal-dependent phosphohydrolase [Alsobacter sp.]